MFEPIYLFMVQALEVHMGVPHPSLGAILEFHWFRPLFLLAIHIESTYIMRPQESVHDLLLNYYTEQCHS